MANIVLKGLTKRFGAVLAVNNLNLTIKNQELLAVIGPSGCGKTTLLRLIAGLETPDGGEIYIGGELANDVKTEKRGVQLVFQNYALWPHMRVSDKDKLTNLSFPMKVRKWLGEDMARRIDRITASVGIDKTLHNRKPTQLSEGQKQRVALGRALVVVPKVLLLDEPMSNLDPPLRIKIRGELRKIHDEYKMTTVLVTHNMADAVAIADRLAIMKEGAIAQVGPPREVYERPVDSFVADFIRCYDVASALREASRKS